MNALPVTHRTLVRRSERRCQQRWNGMMLKPTALLLHLANPLIQPVKMWCQWHCLSSPTHLRLLSPLFPPTRWTPRQFWRYFHGAISELNSDLPQPGVRLPAPLHLRAHLTSQLAKRRNKGSSSPIPTPLPRPSLRSRSSGWTTQRRRNHTHALIRSCLHLGSPTAEHRRFHNPTTNSLQSISSCIGTSISSSGATPAVAPGNGKILSSPPIL